MPCRHPTLLYRMVRVLVTLTLLASFVIPRQFPVANATSRLESLPANSLNHKAIVDSQDLPTLREFARGGAALLVDYGSFSLWRISDSQRSAVATRPSVDLRDDFDSIPLRNFIINTLVTPPVVPDNLSQARSKDPQFWMVQFVGPVKNEWLDDLTNAGLEIVIYMPNSAFVVWGDEIGLGKLDALAAKNPFLQWNGPYHPAYRLHPSLQQTAIINAPGDSVDVTVQLYSTKSVDQSLARLQALGGTIYKQPSKVLNFTNISLQLPVGQLVAVANWPDVFNVEPFVAPKLLDEVQGQILAGQVTSSSGNMVPSSPGYLAWLASKGFPTTQSSYPIVDVVDDGIDIGDASNVLHPDFHELGLLANPDRIPYIGNCTTDLTGNGKAGHGNINAGIVSSYNNGVGSPYQDANGYRIGLGMSPYGQVAGTKIFKNSGNYSISGCGGTDSGVVAASYNSGATMTSDSWGAAVGGAYNSSSQAYDALTRDASGSTPGNQQMLHVFAAGNDGPGATTVGSPGTAKNVLTVGATENVRDQGVADGCGITAANNADDIASFSSRGPTTDGRIKPDITAPGTHVQGPASQDPSFNGSGVCGMPTSSYYPAGQTLYTWSTGTSHSTPALAGAASLVYEYYGRILKPGQTPSPAMLKALLINSSRYLTGVDANDTLPSPKQGWGDVNLGRAFDGAAIQAIDQSTLLGATGQVYTSTGTVADSGKPFRVTLVWSDAPGPTVGNSYVNDLDLEVTIGGNVYKGNVFSGANSTTGGSFDQKNNVENVFIPAGVSGAFSARVIARNIVGDGLPGNGDATDQDFALVIYNGNITPATVLSAIDTRWSEAAGNGNGAMDPSETISLQIDVKNDGNLTATGVSSALALTGGSATISNSSSAYLDIAPGVTRTNTTPYSFVVDPGAPCDGILGLRQVITYNGSLTFTYPFSISIGSPTPGPLTNYAYSGGPIPIPDNNPAGVYANINVSSSQVISDVDVRFSATHPWDSDLDIRLIAPDSTSVELSTDNGLWGDNYTGTIFDDSAATSITAGTAPFTGRFRPESPLSALNGMPLTGTWKLWVVDDAAIDTGSITSFSLDIVPEVRVCTPYTPARLYLPVVLRGYSGAW